MINNRIENVCLLSPEFAPVKQGSSLTILNNTENVVEMVLQNGGAFFDPSDSSPSLTVHENGNLSARIEPSQEQVLLPLSSGQTGDCIYFFDCAPGGGGTPKSIRVDPPG